MRSHARFDDPQPGKIARRDDGIPRFARDTLPVEQRRDIRSRGRRVGDQHDGAPLPPKLPQRKGGLRIGANAVMHDAPDIAENHIISGESAGAAEWRMGRFMIRGGLDGTPNCRISLLKARRPPRQSTIVPMVHMLRPWFAFLGLLCVSTTVSAASLDGVAVDVTNASEPVLCAEKDNVTINFASPTVRNFRIEAAHPTYMGTLRDDKWEPDWTACGALTRRILGRPACS